MKNLLLVFDFFGVICSEISPFWLNRHFSDEEVVKIKRTIVAEADVGAITQKQLFRELSKLSDVAPEIIEKEWFELVSINTEVIDIISEYKKSCRIALLTNSPAPFVRRIIREHLLENYFDLILVSGEEKIAKPDTGFFKLILDRLETEPSCSVMIDDNIINIEAAKSIRMNTIHFTEAKNLRHQLDLLLSK